MTGRHCFECGFSRQESSPNEVSFDEERAKVDMLNQNELSLLMRRYPAMTIKIKDFKLWRPTVRDTGEIRGVAGALTVIATDGLLCYFLTREDQIFLGHKQCFTGDVKTLFSVEKKETTKKEKKKRLTTLERALELLRTLKPQ